MSRFCERPGEPLSFVRPVTSFKYGSYSPESSQRDWDRMDSTNVDMTHDHGLSCRKGRLRVVWVFIVVHELVLMYLLRQYIY